MSNIGKKGTFLEKKKMVSQILPRPNQTCFKWFASKLCIIFIKEARVRKPSTVYPSHPMPPWDKKPCILPTATLGILSFLLPLYTSRLYNRPLFPRQIQEGKSK